MDFMRAAEGIGRTTNKKRCNVLYISYKALMHLLFEKNKLFS